MTNRTLLLTSVAAAALASGMTSKAVAFEVVDWDWTKTVTSIENITVNTNVNINFNGLVELEKWQLFFGNLSAVATVETAPAFPTLLPPYTAESELSTSRHFPA